MTVILSTAVPGGSPLEDTSPFILFFVTLARQARSAHQIYNLRKHKMQCITANVKDSTSWHNSIWCLLWAYDRREWCVGESVWVALVLNANSMDIISAQGTIKGESKSSL